MERRKGENQRKCPCLNEVDSYEKSREMRSVSNGSTNLSSPKISPILFHSILSFYISPLLVTDEKKKNGMADSNNDSLLRCRMWDQ